MLPIYYIETRYFMSQRYADKDILIYRVALHRDKLSLLFNSNCEIERNELNFKRFNAFDYKIKLTTINHLIICYNRMVAIKNRANDLYFVVRDIDNKLLTTKINFAEQKHSDINTFIKSIFTDLEYVAFLSEQQYA